MSTHLDKARAALEAAAALDVDLSEAHLPSSYLRLMDIAAVQASVAQAEALETLAWVELRKVPALETLAWVEASGRGSPKGG